MKKVAISNFFRSKVNSLDPSKYPDTKFHLCSIPAFDKGKPEELLGNEIGSSKKVLIEGDVVLSRLIPHIKRVWEIPILNENTVLGSGEWIVFNSTQVFGGYLRHFLQSELFHKQFMATVKGVGGSLLRADVSQTGKIEIPLPQLYTQQRIATILDEADTLCKKTQQLIDSYDELAQSIFLDMFGDPVMNEKGWKKKPFTYFASIDTKMTTDFKKYQDFPHIGIANIEKDTGRLIDYKKVSDENLTSGKYIFTDKHIIYSKIRPNLNKVALPTFAGLCSADSYPILVNENNSNKRFFAMLLRSKSFLDFILSQSQRTNIPKANKDQMSKYFGIAPPINLQTQFAEKIALIEQQKELAKQSLKESEDLFNTLLQKAFKGELEIK